ncbi:MAG: hypothetical protein ACTH1D_00555 [Mycobacteriaceae bacterium]|uniref:hypothetical protein n=1 Tax=Corynebacterium sp. TaxID=1720 RepID=UPI003F984D19
MTQSSIPDTSAPDSAKKGRLPLVAGLLVAVIGLVFVVGGIVGWFTVKSELQDENITVAEDADRFAGDKVAGPFTAYT